MENNVIARTGRVQSWIDDPTSRLPVSCTVFVVEDSMEGPNGIEASWRFVSHALRFGAGVAVHLSEGGAGRYRLEVHRLREALRCDGPHGEHRYVRNDAAALHRSTSSFLRFSPHSTGPETLNSGISAATVFGRHPPSAGAPHP